MFVIMEAGKETPIKTEKSSLDIVRLLAVFIVMFIAAWILLYPSYLVVELIRLLGYAIGGVLYRGDLSGFSLIPDIIPWHLAGSVTVTKGDTGAPRVLAGLLADLFLFPLLAIAMFALAGWLKPKTLGRSLADDFFELIAFLAGNAMLAATIEAVDNPTIMGTANAENSTFVMLFNALLLIAAVLGLALMIFYALKWLLEFIANAGIMNRDAIWKPYIVAVVALIIGAAAYFFTKDLSLDVMPYVAFITLGLAMFSQAGFPRKEETSSKP